LRAALSTWQAAPAADAVLISGAACYLAAAWRVWRRHPARPWPGIRSASFLAGLGVIAVAIQGSVARSDDVLFSAHMVQHARGTSSRCRHRAGSTHR
jgi:cytochrome c oxidase assembly factor CtaG